MTENVRTKADELASMLSNWAPEGWAARKGMITIGDAETVVLNTVYRKGEKQHCLFITVPCDADVDALFVEALAEFAVGPHTSARVIQVN